MGREDEEVKKLSPGRRRDHQSRASGYLRDPAPHSFWPLAGLPSTNASTAPQKSSRPQAPLTVAAHVGGGEAAEGVPSGRIRIAGHGADHGLQVLLLL